MRESIGAVSLLNFVMFFILLIFAFLIGTFSYYKAYRVNNAIVASIEKFEGHNSYARAEIDEKLLTLAYERYSFNCPKKKNGDLIAGPTGNTLASGYSSERASVSGYCVYAYNDTVEPIAAHSSTMNKTDQYYSYEVTTLITFQFPIIQDVMKLHVSSRTARLYDFEASRAAAGA